MPPITPSDSRNTRQKSSFNDICSIWIGAIDIAAAADGFIKSIGVPVCAYVGVHCKLDQTDYATDVSAVGRRYTANLLTNDHIYFTADQPLKDATFLRLDTPNHPQFGKWWGFQSDPQIYPARGNRNANYAECRVKACTDPTIVPADGDV